MKTMTMLFAVLLSTALAALFAREADSKSPASVARGEYLVQSIGCTDCHTAKRFDPKLGLPVPEEGKFLAGHLAGAPAPAATPGEGDAAVFGMGLTSARLPFGVVYAANLTPDASGLGGWTEEMFVRALRTGRHMGGTGRPILPPMPWDNFRKLSDDDLRAIFAYLRTIPPVKNEVPETTVPPEVQTAIARSYDALPAQAGKAGAR
jgi:hypothetical protein